MTPLSDAIRQIVASSPSLLVYPAGAILALAHLKRAPKPAAYALAGCAMLFVSALVFPIVWSYLLRPTAEHYLTTGRYELTLTLISVAGGVVHVTAFALLLAAVFSGRGAAPVVADTDVQAKEERYATEFPLPHRGNLVFVLGIVSLAVCPPLGMATWIMGRKDLADMRAGLMERSGECETSVGTLFGMLATILFGVGLVGACLWYAFVSTANPVVY